MPDLYAANTVLHLNYNSDAEAWRFPLDCSQAKTVFYSVTPPLICTANDFKYGDQSGYYNGGYSLAEHTANFDLTGVDWTIEAWVKPTGNYGNWNVIAGKRNWNSPYSTEWEVGLSQTTGAMLYYNGTLYRPASGAVPTANVWSHLAYVRSGTSLLFFLNGVNVYSTTLATAVNAGTNIVSIGTWGTEYYLGYMDDLRITKGVARYTSDFSTALPDAIEYTPPVETENLYTNLKPTSGTTDAELYIDTPNVYNYGRTTSGTRDPELYIESPNYNDDYMRPLKSYYTFGGDGKIYGTVKQKSTPANLPLSRRVILFDQKTNIQLAETWSDPVTGEYSFEYLDTSKDFFVVVFDHTGTYRAIAADAIYPTEIT